MVADIPGLIEGASEGKGLGHQFLRHVERARVLVVLVDLAPVDERRRPSSSAILLDELGRYQPDLLERPRLVVGSQADLGRPTSDGDGLDLVVSAVTGEGVAELGRRAWPSRRPSRERRVRRARRLRRPPARRRGLRRRAGRRRRFVVSGAQAERAVALSDLTNAEALADAHDRLRRLGVDRALARAGRQPGDTCRIGGLALRVRASDET